MAAFAFTLGAAWETRDLVFAGAIVAAGFLARVSGAVPWLQRFWQGQLVVFRRHALPLAVVVLLLLWLFVYLAMDIFISVKPGQGGVLWKRFGGGTVTDVVYGEGLHMIPPWDIMYIYDLRYQQQSKEFEVLSSDGLLYSVELTVRYRLRPELLGHFHKCVGPDYVDTMLLPEVGAVTRLVTAQLTPEELYTSKRQASEAEIATRLRLEVAGCAPRDEQNAGTAKGLARTGRYFDASEVFIRRVVLPPKVAEAVESKLAQRQQMLEYDYRIDKERKEAQRKVIEAHGIQAFHEIVNQGMSSAMLQWHGIDAILELAKSPNSKVVLIGSNDKGGLPLLFGSLAAADSPASAPGGANTASPARPHGGLPGLPQTTH
jgi:regulator of protease activity HflC (stomatin/prohibitin superfamily)